MARDDLNLPGQGHPAFFAACEELKERHRLKSGGYGTGHDPFANFTTVAAGTDRQRWEYACDRIVEKVARIRSLTAQGRYDELREEFRDGMGLFGCCDAMLEDDHYQPEREAASVAERIRFEPPADPLCDCGLVSAPHYPCDHEDAPRSHDGMAPTVGSPHRNYLRLDGETVLERERRWQEGGVGLTD